MTYVDHERWSREIEHPDWYLRLRDEYLKLLARARISPRPTARAIADEVYGFFEDALERKTIALAETGPDWDAERQHIDTIVLHHTGLDPGTTISRIEAIHLTRIYASYYTDPALADRAIRGTGIHSGHRRAGRQVFYCYHWLIRPDGTRERLLQDHETGWHAGDWNANCRSVAICLDDNLTHQPPTRAAINAITNLLNTQYTAVSAPRVLGHREINPRTNCPGNRLADWRPQILDALTPSSTR